MIVPIHVNIITSNYCMIVVKIAFFGFVALLFSIGMIAPSYAHTTVHVEQYEFEEIAELLEMKPTAIRVTLSRARKTVREKLLARHSYGIG